MFAPERVCQRGSLRRRARDGWRRVGEARGRRGELVDRCNAFARLCVVRESVWRHPRRWNCTHESPERERGVEGAMRGGWAVERPREGVFRGRVGVECTR